MIKYRGPLDELDPKTTLFAFKNIILDFVHRNPLTKSTVCALHTLLFHTDDKCKTHNQVLTRGRRKDIFETTGFDRVTAYIFLSFY
jgi:hypothetical protein